MKVLVSGADSSADVPGIDAVAAEVELAFAGDGDALRKALPDTEVLLLWDFKNRDLQRHWREASSLKWIQWCGAGVDGILFDELRTSDVILTNAKGIFDRPMAETLLGYLLMVVKDFRTSMRHQDERKWQYRMSRQLKGTRALIFGVGSIGREFARVLGGLGVDCHGAGRTARGRDDDFSSIFASSDLETDLRQYDWVINVMPATGATTGYFNGAFFDAMSPDAFFINMGRGTAVVEADLITALEKEDIAGAMLDVFRTEPLEAADPMWRAKNLFVSPHISGDYDGFEADLVSLFRSNLDRYLGGQPLENVVDKQLGFVR